MASIAVLLVPFVALASLPGAECYLEARDAERAAKYGDALATYEACIAKDGPLAPYARVRHAFCQGAAGDNEGAIAAYRRLLETPEDGPWKPMARTYLASLLAMEKRHKEAAALFDVALSHRVKPWWMANYEWRAAEDLIDEPAYRTTSFGFFRGAVESTSHFKKRLKAAKHLCKSPSPADRLAAAFGMLRSGARPDALEVLSGMAPPEVNFDELRNLNAKALSTKSRSRDAARDNLRVSLQVLAQQHPKDDWVRVCLACVVRYQTLKAGSATVALTASDLLAKYYPETDAAANALLWLARRYADVSASASAVQTYLRLAETCPEHSLADDALFNAATLLRQSKETADADKTLLKLADCYPDSRYAARALYRVAAGRERAGNTKTALHNYRRATGSGMGKFHAHLALERLRKAGDDQHPTGRNLHVDGSDSFIRPFPLPPVPPPEIPPRLMSNPRFERIVFFGMHGLEEGEWEALGFSKALEYKLFAGLLYEIMGESGLAYTAMNFASALDWGMKDGRPNTSRLRISYPRAYWPHVLATAKKTRLDPYLILAVARQESTFRPALTSHAGASGLMQLMPATAKWLVKADDTVQPKHAANLEAPLNSLHLGATYLRRMVERSDGNLVFALASYNAGPGNCDKWRRRFGKISLEKFVESIPFYETRDYVRKVLGNYAAYHSLYLPVE